jgi:flagellar export protein FliJ
MKPFEFPLDRVLDWHRTDCERCAGKIKRTSTELDRAKLQLAQLRASRVACEQQVISAPRLDILDLNSLAAYRQRACRREQTLARACSQFEARLAEERRNWQEASRRLRVLEKLKARRLAEYDYEFDREVEAFASEAYLAQWQARAAND